MGRLPFIFARETERTSVDRVYNDPIKRQALYDMIDAVLRVNETHQVTPSELAPIIAGFHFTDEGVWSRAAGWLAKLHAFDPAVASTLEELSTHPSVTPRLNLCRSLDRFPTATTLPLFRRFLDDKSVRVQDAALALAMTKRITQLLPDLHARLLKEKKPARIPDFQEAIDWLEGTSSTIKGVKFRQLPNGDLEGI